nr:unnamed protein product [Callosobruchus analis]
MFENLLEYEVRQTNFLKIT